MVAGWMLRFCVGCVGVGEVGFSGRGCGLVRIFMSGPGFLECISDCSYNEYIVRHIIQSTS